LRYPDARDDLARAEMTVKEILEKLESLGSVANVAGRARFGISTPDSFGTPTPVLKEVAKEAKRSAADRHRLALELWKTGNYEARAVAFMIDDPKQVTAAQMESWAADFDNWATVDSACSYLFCRTSLAYEKARDWAERKPEFIKRAGFALMAFLAVHDKKAEDEKLAAFLPLIEKHSDDDRNFVTKAVNWALRQIGKRSLELNRLAIETAERIKARDSKPARWIASDALRELKSEAVVERLQSRKSKMLEK
jgi:3-methyladenine DNA glycosylase AlkD